MMVGRSQLGKEFPQLSNGGTMVDASAPSGISKSTRSVQTARARRKVDGKKLPIGKKVNKSRGKNLHGWLCPLTVLDDGSSKFVTASKKGKGVPMQESQKPETPTLPRNFIVQQDLADLFKISPQAVSMWVKKHDVPTFSVANKRAMTQVNARNFLEQRSVKFGKEVIAFQMLKGGSTKTSSAFNLAIRLNQYGARVLCIDLDMQGNLSDAFGLDPADSGLPIMVNVVKKECSIEDTVVPICEGLDIIPSDFDNSVLEIEMTSRKFDIR